MKFSAGVVLLIATGFCSNAIAQNPPAVTDQFFEGANAINGTYVGLGVLGMTTGGLMLRSNDDLIRSSGIVIGAVGVIHLASAIGLLVSLRHKREALPSLADPIAHERARVAELRRRFPIYHAVEISVALIGVSLLGVGLGIDRDGIAGIGLGLAVDGLVTWLMDLGASANADRYAEVIRAF